MEKRINFQEKGQNALKALFGIGGYLKKSQLDQHLLETGVIQGFTDQSVCLLP
jgi:hypothetical protein